MAKKTTRVAAIVPDLEQRVEEHRYYKHAPAPAADGSVTRMGRLAAPAPGTDLVVAGPRTVHLTPEQADREQQQRVRRATNTAPAEPMNLPRTPAGMSLLAIEIAHASGLRLRKRRRGFIGRLLSRL